MGVSGSMFIYGFVQISKEMLGVEEMKKKIEEGSCK